MSAFPQLNIGDAVFQRFMDRQYEEGMALARSSDLVRLEVSPIVPPHFFAVFHCDGLVQDGAGMIRKANEFRVAVWFPPDYLRHADSFDVLRILTRHVWHPNVSLELPLICVGRLAPGTSLVDILYQVYDILTYQKYNPREYDSLNRAACAWARANQDRLPIDRRPLKRMPLELEVKAL
jgi:hypothetical protein